MKQRLISIPFFLLRAGTAGAALVTGLLQTYVFAHVLSPQRFSMFILVAAIGYSLWLIDFGIVKILFVRLRGRFLAGDHSDTVAGHATSVVLFYAGLVLTGALACFVFMAVWLQEPLREAAEFGLFFLFVPLNLVWFALRNIAIAVDDYVLFETLETVRRGGYFVGLAAVLVGLPFIAMLKERLEVVRIAGPIDFRLDRLRSARVYFTPLDEVAEDGFDALWREILGGDEETGATLEVLGRSLRLPRAMNGLLRASFASLCDTALGPQDYLAIAARFQTVFLEGVPRMTPAQRNEARRFVWMVDALYEARAKLVVLAQAEPDGLYPSGDGAFEFERTASRLEEMRSAAWFNGEAAAP